MREVLALGQAVSRGPQTERALQKIVLDLLRARGAHVENRSPGPFSGTGVPDITGVYRGVAIAIELKHPLHHGPTASDTRWPSQLFWLRAHAKAGGVSFGTNNAAAVGAILNAIDGSLNGDKRVDLGAVMELWT